MGAQGSKTIGDMRRQVSSTTGLGIKVSQPTVDLEFNNLKERHSRVAKDVSSFKKNVKTLRKAWGEVKTANMSIAQAGAAFSDDNRWDDYHQKLEAWGVDAVDAQVETSPLHQYEGQITSYLAMVKETGKVVAKRDKAVRTLDFYRGEIERLEAKPEVPEAELAEARTQADAARPLYEQANSEALQSLKEVMARGEELLRNAATCVVETQEQIAKSFPGEL